MKYNYKANNVKPKRTHLRRYFALLARKNVKTDLNSQKKGKREQRVHKEKEI